LTLSTPLLTMKSTGFASNGARSGTFPRSVGDWVAEERKVTCVNVEYEDFRCSR